MKAVVAAFNQEKALVGAFSVISNLRMELFQALVARRRLHQPGLDIAGLSHAVTRLHKTSPILWSGSIPAIVSLCRRRCFTKHRQRQLGILGKRAADSAPTNLAAEFRECIRMYEG